MSSEEEFNNIIEEYKSMVYGIALTHVRTKYNADEVFQEVFLAFYWNKKKFSNEEHRKAWLIKTTLNQCRKITTNAWWKKIVLFNNIKDVNNENEKIFQFQLPQENLVYTAICELPKKYRRVVYLYYFEGYKTKEISNLLEIKESTVRTQLTRAREMLKVKLKGGIFDE